MVFWLPPHHWYTKSRGLQITKSLVSQALCARLARLMRSPVLILVTKFYPEISLVRLLREIPDVQPLVLDHILPADVTENIRVIFTLTSPCCHLQNDTKHKANTEQFIKD